MPLVKTGSKPRRATRVGAAQRERGPGECVEPQPLDAVRVLGGEPPEERVRQPAARGERDAGGLDRPARVEQQRLGAEHVVVGEGLAERGQPARRDGGVVVEEHDDVAGRVREREVVAEREAVVLGAVVDPHPLVTSLARQPVEGRGHLGRGAVVPDDDLDVTLPPAISDSTHAVVSSLSSYVGTITDVSPDVGVRASRAAQSTRCRLSTTRRQSPGGGRSARRRSGNRRRTPMLGTNSTSVPWRIRRSSSQATGSAGSTGPRPRSASRWATSRTGSTSGAGVRKTTLLAVATLALELVGDERLPQSRPGAPAGPAPTSRRRRGTRRTPPSRGPGR